MIIVMVSLSVASDATAKKSKKPKNPNGPPATVTYDGNAFPNVIYGSGNANGSFTVFEKDGIEVALRGKVRFPVPTGAYNSNGDGTYSFDAGDACPGFGWLPAPLCLATPVWNYDWSINTDTTGSTGMVVSDYRYEIGLDRHSGSKTMFTTFDPISPSLAIPAWDHSFGDNGTLPNAGSEVTGPTLPNFIAQYSDFLDNSNVVQNSWNYEFHNEAGTGLENFDPADGGRFVIFLRVIDPEQNKTLVEARIEVITTTP
jgi:hypothetical protein